MKLITVPTQMQRQALRWRRVGKRIALVPTMGALHEGHLSLIRRARSYGDIVVVSVYVNPTQFGPKEDFKKYPRNLKQDAQLAKKAGADVVFAPRTLYSPDASTFVEEVKQSQGRCGDSRPGHFRGVTTVVCKLFLLVQPDAAIFGQKDAQQCDVIERMARDLFFPIKIVRCPIVRDKNGLALSSRNAYLSAKGYEKALALSRSLHEAARKPGLSARQVEQRARKLLLKQPGMKVEYVRWSNGTLGGAVRVDETRLIDNVRYSVRKGAR